MKKSKKVNILDNGCRATVGLSVVEFAEVKIGDKEAVYVTLATRKHRWLCPNWIFISNRSESELIRAVNKARQYKKKIFKKH
jgi:hypothetical protein